MTVGGDGSGRDGGGGVALVVMAVSISRIVPRKVVLEDLDTLEMVVVVEVWRLRISYWW